VVPLLMMLIFLSASLGVAATYSIYRDLRHRDMFRARRRMESEFQKPQEKVAPRGNLFKSVSEFDLGKPPADDFSADTSSLAVPLPVVEHTDVRTRVQSVLTQSDLPLTLTQLGYISGGTALAGAALGLFFGGYLLALIGFVCLGLVPMGYIRYRQKMRHDYFLKQLPDAFDLMARVLRSGNSVSQAFQAVADSFEPPIASEFAFCQEQQNLGMLPEATYRDLARRTGVLEIKIFIMAMMIQRQTGGNLSEVLERLASLCRERVRLRNHVRALTAEGRLQAVVLLVMPVVMFFIMRLINRSYADVLLEHTGLLAGMAGSMLLGALWIRKIIQFDF